MKHDLTKEDVEDYLGGDTYTCPFCRTDDLEFQPIDTDGQGRYFYQGLKCNRCLASWDVGYAKTSIAVMQFPSLSPIEEIAIDLDDQIATGDDGCET